MDNHGSFIFNDFLVLQWFRADPRVRPTPLGGPLQAISDGQAKVRPTSVWGGMPAPLRPETDRSSYRNQPPTWQPHAFRQLLYHPLCAQKQIEVATQTSLQHGSRMPSDSCYATPSALRNRSALATQTSLQHGSRLPSNSCYATPSALQKQIGSRYPASDRKYDGVKRGY